MLQGAGYKPAKAVLK